MTIDWSIQLGDLILAILGLVVTLAMVPLLTFLKDTRDFNREVTSILRGHTGTNGLIGDVKGLKHEIYESGGKLSKLWHYLANLRIGLAKQDITTPELD